MEGMTRALGTPATWEHAGKAYSLAPWDYDLMGLFAAWVYDRAKKLLKAERAEDGEDEYARRMRELRQDRDGGLFDWGSEVVTNAWRRGEGAKYIVFLTLSKADGTVTRQFVDELFKDKAAFWGLIDDVLIPLNFGRPAPADQQTDAGGNP